MEEVVAIKIVDSARRAHFFLTWGRVFDRVDPKQLLAAVRAVAPQFGIAGIRDIQVCYSLQEAARQLYFYEALLSFSQQRIPYGKTYTQWKAARRRQIKRGKEIFYLGRHHR